RARRKPVRNPLENAREITQPAGEGRRSAAVVPLLTLVWGFSCQAIVFGFSSQFLVRSGKGRSSSRRLRSGSRSARKGSRDRNASGAWRRAALASLVFRSLERLSPWRDDEQRDGLLVSKLRGLRHDHPR